MITSMSTICFLVLRLDIGAPALRLYLSYNPNQVLFWQSLKPAGNGLLRTFFLSLSELILDFNREKLENNLVSWLKFKLSLNS